ncbi:lipoprotein insertase outer membrane protein LolB [Variovorax sp. LT1R16]|uniref:lipoprotein insertase outer membrane protein LolB n=1 Tax=Variovorax sp. LT1R16 TaxID=3443728 RepID=UPI003F482FD0
MTARRHLLKASGAALAAVVLAGCATPGKSDATSPDGERPENWSGRMSLRIDSDPVQTFSALFDLRGGPERGTLTLTTPIGSTLAELQWAPGEALLKNGSETRRYASVGALIEAATGASIPVGALFGWLAGRDEAVPGWQPDLSQRAAGRLQAVRESPLPRADLRIAFARE